MAPGRDGRQGGWRGQRGHHVSGEPFTRRPGRPSPEPPAGSGKKLNACTEHTTPAWPRATQKTPFARAAGGPTATMGGRWGQEVVASGTCAPVRSLGKRFLTLLGSQVGSGDVRDFSGSAHSGRPHLSE